MQNSIELAYHESNITFLDCYKGTLLSKLISSDKKNTMKIVYCLLERLNDQFNMNLKLNGSQLTTISFDLMEKFKGESIEDILLFFKMARLGELGAKMHRLDSHVIFNEWFPEYMNLKSEKREDLLKNKKEISKIDLNSKQEWDDDSRRKLKEVINSVSSRSLKKTRDFKNKVDSKHLENSDSFLEKLKEDVKQMSLEELSKFKKYCKNRQFYEKYLEVVVSEMELRNK